MKPGSFFLGLRLSVTILVFLIAFGEVWGDGAKAQAEPTQALTNKDVIKMVQAKLGDGVIVAKIKSSPCQFDTSTDALIELKEAGVSDAVMQAMAEAGQTAAPAVPAGAPEPPQDPNDPLSPHDRGIYYLQRNAEEGQMLALDPPVVIAGKGGGAFKSGFTMGIAKAKVKHVVKGSRAKVRVIATRPTFYFYEQDFGQLSSVAYLANRLAVVRMEKKKDGREVVYGEFGSTGSRMGFRFKDTVGLDIEKLSAGIYKLTPQNDLDPGEYCFSGGQTLIFEFGVDQAR